MIRCCPEHALAGGRATPAAGELYFTATACCYGYISIPGFTGAACRIRIGAGAQIKSSAATCSAGGSRSIKTTDGTGDAVADNRDISTTLVSIYPEHTLARGRTSTPTSTAGELKLAAITCSDGYITCPCLTGATGRERIGTRTQIKCGTTACPTRWGRWQARSPRDEGARPARRPRSAGASDRDRARCR